MIAQDVLSNQQAISMAVTDRSWKEVTKSAKKAPAMAVQLDSRFEGF
jgi:hypothetical protein